MSQFLGNNDFRGYLAYQAQNGADPAAKANASNALNYVGGNYTGNGTTGINQAAFDEYNQAAPGAADPRAGANQYLQDAYKQYTGQSGSVLSDQLQKGDTSITANKTAPASTADDVSFLNDQEASLNKLLGRTNTGLDQGLSKLGTDYQTNVDQQNAAEKQALSGYADKRVQQNQGKQTAYDTINRNAGTGYNSLAQLIGRASGRGSSAFQELLPNVIGKDASSKRLQATDTYGQNLQGIDKAQNNTELSFQNILADLLKQKKQGEEDLKSGIEGQRQGILNQILGVQGQRAQAKGGGYAAVKAAQAGTNQAIDNSRNSVEGFFNQFRTPYTPQQAAVATPDLAAYQVDRAGVNAAAQGQDANNPYASILRRKLSGNAI